MGRWLGPEAGFLSAAGQTALAVARHKITQNLKNPNVNLARAGGLADPNAKATEIRINPNGPPGAIQGPPAPPPAPPVDHATYGALSSYYGKIVGAVPYDTLAARFEQELQQVAERQRVGTYDRAGDVKADRRDKMLDQLNSAKTKQRIDAEKVAQKTQADAQKAAEKAAEQRKKDEAAAKTKADAHIQELLANENVAHGPVMKATEAVMPIESVSSHTSKQAHGHEAGGHVMAYTAEGLDPYLFVSEHHPDSVKAGAGAQVH